MNELAQPSATNDDQQTLSKQEQTFRALVRQHYLNKMLPVNEWRKTRTEELMRRKSAQKWDAKKKARMSRKLMGLTTTISRMSEELEAVNDLLTKAFLPKQ